MTDKPIIFSAPMVRALLREAECRGTGKTTTRRIMKLPTKGEYVRPDMGGWEPTTIGGKGTFHSDGSPAPEMVAIWNRTTGTCVAAPYKVGDRLYVRESIHRDKMENLLTGERTTTADVAYYSADNTPCLNEHGFNLSWTWKRKNIPSIHMPRTFSRLTLIVTSVKIENLQDISREDAIAEGLDWVSPSYGIKGIASTWHEDPRVSFAELFKSINGEDIWEKNPWVVAPSFSVHATNIDAMKEAA